LSARDAGPSNLLYLFENCSLDSDRRELRRAGTLVAVEPQVFDVLHAPRLEGRPRALGVPPHASRRAHASRVHPTCAPSRRSRV